MARKKCAHWPVDPDIRYRAVAQVNRPATWSAREWESFIMMLGCAYRFLVWSAEMAIAELPADKDGSVFADAIAAILDSLRVPLDA